MRLENLNIYNLENAIRGSKFPMSTDTQTLNEEITNRTISLGNAESCSGHDCFLKGILVTFDLTFSNKAWVELERYHFIDFVSSQSTMHKITQLDIRKSCNKYVWESTIKNLECAVAEYNSKDLYWKNSEKGIKAYLEILYNVPSGFELTAQMTTNYLQLKTIYKQRKNHKLPEWRKFCEYIKDELPYFKELCLKK